MQLLDAILKNAATLLLAKTMEPPRSIMLSSPNRVTANTVLLDKMFGRDHVDIALGGFGFGSVGKTYTNRKSSSR